MSAQTEKMTEKRKSPEVKKFKEKIETFFKEAKVPSEIQYKIRVDLSKKMDMPYYKEKKKCIKSNISCVEIAKKYIEYLIEYGNYEFSEKLINELTKHQQQTLRKIHPRNKEQKRKKKYLEKGSIWEHPIPTNYSKQRILEYIKDGNLDKAKAFIDYLSKVPQIALSKDNDRSVNADWKDSMPEWWNWEEIGKNDPFARYKAAKIPEDSYK